MATRTPPRLMMELDQPQKVSPRSRAVLIGGLLIYAVALPIVASFASVPMSYNAGAIATASAWVTAALGGVIGILFWWHGTGTGRRGYLILASAWFYVSCLAVVFPFVYPNALVIAVPPAPLLGSSQSGGWLLAFSHLFFTSGLTAGAAVLDHDRRHARRPRLSHEPSLYLTTAAAGVLVAVAVPIILVGRLPAMNSQVGQSAPPGVFVAMSIVVLVALAGLVVTGRAFRHGSMIMRWLFTVLVVEVGAATSSAGAVRGTVGWLWFKFVPMLWMSIMLVVLVWALTRIGRATEALASEDWLTTAASRVQFEQDLEREVALASTAARSATLVWLDLDSFKGVNDQFGHAVGDEVLREVAARIKSVVRDVDYVGRLGGDEFGVLLGQRELSGPTDVDVVVTRLLSEIRRPFQVMDATIRLSASAGVASAPKDARGPAELLGMADLAMYRAKALGGNCAQWYSIEMSSNAVVDAELRQNLAVAISNCAFDLDYQLVVDLTTGKPAGAEALVRWIREGRRINAGAFIEYAEMSGQIVDIGGLVVGRLERDVPIILSQAAPGFLMHLNLSIKELAAGDLIKRLATGPLAAYADRIVVEVTETQPSTTLGELEGPLAKLTAVGYRVAIDDFGTGYSNLARLARLRPSIIKIDRSMTVDPAGDSGKAVRLLRATVAICTAVDATPIVEGVETEEQASLMRSLGITHAQGYLFARPQPRTEFLQRLTFWPAANFEPLG